MINKLQRLQDMRINLRALERELETELEKIFPDWYWSDSKDCIDPDYASLDFPSSRTWKNPDREITHARRTRLIELGFKRVCVTEDRYLELDVCSSSQDELADELGELDSI